MNERCVEEARVSEMMNEERKVRGRDERKIKEGLSEKCIKRLKGKGAIGLVRSGQAHINEGGGWSVGTYLLPYLKCIDINIDMGIGRL